MDPFVSTVIMIILLFVDGLIFGVAAARGVVSIILIIVGLLLASFIGLSIPLLNLSDILSRLSSFVASEARVLPGIFYAFPSPGESDSS